MTPSSTTIIVPPHRFGIKNENDKFFLPLMLKSLVRNNPGFTIIFPNPNGFKLNITGVDEFFYEENDILELQKFRQVYTHLSTNPYDFELACFERFFIIRMIMEKFHINHAYTVESDCLLFKPINLLLSSDAMIGHDVLLTDETCISTAFISLDFIQEYCFEVISSYTDAGRVSYMKEWHAKFLDRKNMGGICDMTFCNSLKTGWLTNKSKLSISNFSIPFNHNGKTCFYDNFFSNDAILSSSRRFAMETSNFTPKLHKKYQIVDQKVIATLDNEESVDLCSIHFQGSNKLLMGHMYANFY